MILSKRNTLFRWGADRQLQPLLAALALATAAMLLLIVTFLLLEAWPVVANGRWRDFFTDESWYPLEGQFGLLPMLWGSIAIMVGAMILAAPLGLAAAIFASFYASGFVLRVYQMLMALLAGMPSVVLGLWGLMVLVPLLAAWQPPGASLLAAMLVLSLMILPTVALASASALASVPKPLMAGAAALGMCRKSQIMKVAIPVARHGIWSAMLLAVARALGETMVVLMVAGNVVQYPHGLFEPVRALTANIALEMGYAMEDHRAGLFASGLMLTSIVLLLAWLAGMTAKRELHHV
ncbi:MAG: phosphate ABC transporter permease subunit PstC [Mariprofundaceae bacterium]|nr:phosphate ABC transporter permease subunit PstC [Mariprofundaceae bacterium]